jgi:hypothetical protein
MPRIMDDSLNTLKIFDNISNSDLEVQYRSPTTEERAAFSNQSIKRTRNKLTFRTAQARQKFGLMILTGIREGDFIIKKGGKNVPLASDPKSPNYDQKWKEIMMKYASDIIEVLAAFVFEGSAEAEDKDEDGGSSTENAEKN